ncbi:putative transposase [Shigella flexneri K-218]|nr:putative transposase [Shigella flexneri K-218]
MFPDFFMHIGQALDLVSRYDSLRNPLTSLGITSPRTHLSLPCRIRYCNATQAPSSPRNDGLVYCWHGA